MTKWVLLGPFEIWPSGGPRPEETRGHCAGVGTYPSRSSSTRHFRPRRAGDAQHTRHRRRCPWSTRRCSPYPPCLPATGSAVPPVPSGTLRSLRGHFKMMGLFRFARRIQSSFKAPTRTRQFSEASSPPDTCFIMGNHGPVAMSGESWIDCDLHFHEQPLLSPITPYRLILKIDPSRPYMLNEPSRGLIRTGCFVPAFANNRSESYSGCFRRGNVGILRDLNIFAFRKLIQDVDRKWISNPSAGFNEYGLFLRGLIQQFIHRVRPAFRILPPEELCIFIRSLEARIVDVVAVIHHPAMLSDLRYARVAAEISRILWEEGPVVGTKTLADTIYTRIGRVNYGCLLTFQKHAYLNAFLPISLRNPNFVPPNATATGGGAGAGFSVRTQLSEYSRGVVLINGIRHLCVHPVKEESQRTVIFLPGKSSVNLTAYPATKVECVQLARYTFALLLPCCFEVMRAVDDSHFWKVLDMDSLDPIPEIYWGKFKNK